MPRLRDDCVAEARLKQKRCEDSPHSKALTRTQAGRQCEIKEALFLDRMAAHWRLDQHRVYLCGGGPRNCDEPFIATNIMAI